MTVVFVCCVQGYLVHVNGRDVNIGSGTCSLFCFTLARAMLAERFGADNGRIARIILVSTAAAFLTFSGAVALLK